MFDVTGEPSSEHGASRLTLATQHVSVRTAGATDWQALLAFHERLYLETPSRFVSEHLANHYAYRQPLLALKDDLGCLLDGALGLVLVAEHDGELVGYITGQLQVDERRVYGRIGLVQDWFVVERCRGQGIGRLLMEAIIARLHELGCDAVESTTYAENACARGAHAALGFVDVEVRMRIDLHNRTGA